MALNGGTPVSVYAGENLRDVEEYASAALAAVQRLKDAIPPGNDIDDLISSLQSRNTELENKVSELQYTIEKMKRSKPINPPASRLTINNARGSFVYMGRRDRKSTASGLILHRAKTIYDAEDVEHIETEDAATEDMDPWLKKIVDSGAEIDNEVLKKIPILARDEESGERSGFRLLLASDERRELQQVKEGSLTVSHMTKLTVKLKWCVKPALVLLIKKPGDPEITDALIEVAKVLEKEKINVIVESKVLQSDIGAQATKNMLGRPANKFDDEPIDFVICLGGDGTIIWAASKFRRGVPPILAFAMGSLGFLAPFPVATIVPMIKKVLTEDMEATVRSRIMVEVHKVNSFNEEVTSVEQVLNEVVVDRGPNGTMVNLEMYIGDESESVTSVQADGIIVATPTGSTAYSLASGGSMVHPAIPAMVVTPICPHTLSFRPVVVADSTYVRLRVPDEARTTAFVSFDGRSRTELKRGDYIDCKVSQYPLTAYCSRSESVDWFNSIKEAFHWNKRTLQKKV